MDELLATVTTELSTGGADIYSDVFVVPKCTDGLWSILNLKWFNHYVHITYF